MSTLPIPRGANAVIGASVEAAVGSVVLGSVVICSRAAGADICLFGLAISTGY